MFPSLWQQLTILLGTLANIAPPAYVNAAQNRFQEKAASLDCVGSSLNYGAAPLTQHPQNGLSRVVGAVRLAKAVPPRDEWWAAPCACKAPPGSPSAAGKTPRCSSRTEGNCPARWACRKKPTPLSGCRNPAEISWMCKHLNHLGWWNFLIRKACYVSSRAT